MTDKYRTLAYGQELSAAAGGIATIVANTVTVAADVATLVADGASPTQAHVTTLNTDWGTLLTSWNSFRALAPSAALFVNIDTTQVPTVSVLSGLLTRILQLAAGQGMAP